MAVSVPRCQGRCPLAREGRGFLAGRDAGSTLPTQLNAAPRYLKRMHAPNAVPLRQLAPVAGNAEAPPCRWRRQARAQGQLPPDAKAPPDDGSLRDRIAAMFEAAAVNDTDLAAHRRQRDSQRLGPCQQLASRPGGAGTSGASQGAGPRPGPQGQGAGAGRRAAGLRKLAAARSGGDRKRKATRGRAQGWRMTTWREANGMPLSVVR